MSSVFKRKRRNTEIQFLATAWELQVELTKFLMNDKNLPKKWRLIIAQPLIAKVDELVDNLNYANCIYPVTCEEYQERSKYQTIAIANCWQLHNKLVRTIECVESAKIEKLDKVIELLEKEETLLKSWKKSDKERYKRLWKKSDNTEEEKV